MTTTRTGTTGLAESPLLSNGHGGFGKRPGETGRSKDRHRAPGRLRGGKANFAVDRQAAEQAYAAWPGGLDGVRGVRADARAHREAPFDRAPDVFPGRLDRGGHVRAHRQHERQRESFPQRRQHDGVGGAGEIIPACVTLSETDPDLLSRLAQRQQRTAQALESRPARIEVSYVEEDRVQAFVFARPTQQRGEGEEIHLRRSP